MVVIEFGGLKELADTANNYHANINKLCGNFDEFTLAINKVVRNIVVLMYAHYIDRWPINGTCVGHRALLMQSMLEFAFIYGRYCRREWQLKRFNPTADDPRLSVDALMKDDEEEIRRMDMFCMFKTGMDIMGGANSALYCRNIIDGPGVRYDVHWGLRHRATTAEVVQDEKGDGRSLPARENGVVEENTFLQGLPKGGLWHSCARMLEDADAGAPDVRVHAQVPQPTSPELVH